MNNHSNIWVVQNGLRMQIHTASAVYVGYIFRVAFNNIFVSVYTFPRGPSAIMLDLETASYNRSRTIFTPVSYRYHSEHFHLVN